MWKRKNLESEIKPQQNTDKRVDEKELKHNYKIEINAFLKFKMIRIRLNI